MKMLYTATVFLGMMAAPVAGFAALSCNQVLLKTPQSHEILGYRLNRKLHLPEGQGTKILELSDGRILSSNKDGLILQSTDGTVKENLYLGYPHFGGAKLLELGQDILVYNGEKMDLVNLKDLSARKFRVAFQAGKSSAMRLEKLSDRELIIANEEGVFIADKDGTIKESLGLQSLEVQALSQNEIVVLTKKEISIYSREAQGPFKLASSIKSENRNSMMDNRPRRIQVVDKNEFMLFSDRDARIYSKDAAGEYILAETLSIAYGAFPLSVQKLPDGGYAVLEMSKHLIGSRITIWRKDAEGFKESEVIAVDDPRSFVVLDSGAIAAVYNSKVQTWTMDSSGNYTALETIALHRGEWGWQIKKLSQDRFVVFGNSESLILEPIK